MGERIKSFDWPATALGPLARWPQSLRRAVRVLLTSRQPISIAGARTSSTSTTTPTRPSSGKAPARARPARAGGVARNLGRHRAAADDRVGGDEGTYVEDAAADHGAQRLSRRDLLHVSRTARSRAQQGGPAASSAPTPTTRGASSGERQLRCCGSSPPARSTRAPGRKPASGAPGRSTTTRAISLSRCSTEAAGRRRLVNAGSTGFGGPHPAALPEIRPDEAIVLAAGHSCRPRRRFLRRSRPALRALLADGRLGQALHRAAIFSMPENGQGREWRLIVGLNPCRRIDDTYRNFSS